MGNIVIATKNPAHMSEEELAAFIKAKPDEAVVAFRGLLARNTSILPDTAFVKRGENGLLRKVSIRVTLTEEMREVVRIPGRDVYNKQTSQWEPRPDTYDISAVGLRKLNQTAGLHCITPDHVVVAGDLQPNPFIETDPVYRRPRRVYVRRVVIGPAMTTGNLVATDITLVLDLELYILENLLKKLQYSKDPAHLGRYGEAQTRPESDDKHLWRFYSIDSDVGVWFNIMHPDFQKCMSEHVQRCKFADRIAQTLAERNAMKAHPGMPASIAVDSSGRLRVPMVAWVSSVTADQVERLRQMVNAGTLKEEMEVESVQHNANAEADMQDAEHVSAEESQAEPEDSEDKPAAKSAAPKPESGTPADEDDVTPVDRLKLIERAVEVHADLLVTMGKKKLGEAMGQLGILGKPDTATDEQLKAFIALKTKS